MSLEKIYQRPSDSVTSRKSPGSQKKEKIRKKEKRENAKTKINLLRLKLSKKLSLILELNMI